MQCMLIWMICFTSVNHHISDHVFIILFFSYPATEYFIHQVPFLFNLERRDILAQRSHRRNLVTATNLPPH